MMFEKWNAVLIIGLLLFTIPVHAAYNVDEVLLYEEESEVIKAEAKLDLLANGINRSATTDRSRQMFSASVGSNLTVEKERTGYWADGKVEISHDQNETSTADNRTSMFEIKNFDDNYSSNQGLYDFGYADAGHKWYFSKQSPYYGFAQGLLNYTYRDDSPDPVLPIDDGLESAVAGGVGYGKIVDLGSYERVLIVQDQLLAAGLINQAFSRSVTRELLPFFRRSMDKTDRLIEVKRVLVNNGLVTDKDITLDIANDIQDAIDESFEKREYGFEARAAFRQELTHMDSDETKRGYIFGYVKYEKPLAENHQYTSQFDVFQQVIGSDSEKIFYAGWLNKITSTFGQYIETEAGLVLTFRDEINNRATEKLYGKLTYEITEVLSWENSVFYEFVQDNDDRIEYEVRSVLTYTIW